MMSWTRFLQTKMKWPRMVKNVSLLLVLSFTAACMSSGIALGQEKDTLQKQLEPSVLKLSEGLYRIGSVILDRNKNEIRVEGSINMQRGVIEYLACARAGKLHESVLVVNVKPYELQVALLLLGLEPGGNLEYQGDPRTPEGDSVEVWVEWEERGEVKKHRAEDFVFNIFEKRPMKPTPWIFTGSRIENGVFMANVEQSLIATYHDPYALIDHPLPTGADDTIYRVNEDLVPVKGTPVTVLLRSFQSGTKQ